MSSQKKKILVCPLNWGLGHAARDVGIIRRLLDLGHNVVIAADGAALELLRQEFPEAGFPESMVPPSKQPESDISPSEIPEPEIPQLEILSFPSRIRIRYSLVLPAWLKITILSPFLLFEILSEHRRLARMIEKLNFDVVISDNRYGLWNRRVKSILITHQLKIRLPGILRIFEYPASLVIRAFVKKFDQCWIPDYPGSSNLTGDLSHRYKLPQNSVFIGAISRFGEGPSTSVPYEDPDLSSDSTSSTDSRGPVLDLLILLSGPEPQRSRLQKILLKQIFSIDWNCVILQGIPGKYQRTDLTSTVSMYNHLPARELQNLLKSARFIICRSGYTGIMDLALLQKKALIIPTPGQTEQIYLSEYLSEKGMFLTSSQDNLNLESAIQDLSDFNPVFDLPSEDLLGNVLPNLAL